MDRHPRVLQLWVQAAPIRGRERQPLERVRREQHGRDEEQRDDAGDGAHVGHESLIPTWGEPLCGGGKSGQNQRPKKQASRLATPKGRNGINDGELATGVTCHVGDVEIPAEKRDQKGQRRDAHHTKKRVHGTSGAFHQLQTAVLPGNRTDDGSPQSQEKPEAQRKVS